MAGSVLVVAVWLWAGRVGLARPAQPLTPAEQEVKAAVRALWQREDDAATSGNAEGLPPLFDLQTAEGQASLKHAQSRMHFVQAWAGARGVLWRPAEVTVRTPRIRFGAGDPPGTVDITAIVSEAWHYTYPGSQLSQTFGLGREHDMRLARTPDGWRIVHDWFTDPLDQDTRIPSAAIPGASDGSAAGSSTTSQSPEVAGVAEVNGDRTKGYNPTGAVAYADRYCGAAPGCGNNGRYNSRFFDYNGDGGDCTNFISQALALGGGLRSSGAWNYDRRTGEGTAAWVKSGMLAGHLLGSGWARVVARGTYPKVSTATAQLRPGDVIAYMEKGEIVHLAMVTGTDPRGYVLVDSHTADRYHVPWDIGWDRGAVFVLLQMREAAAVHGPALVPEWVTVGGSGCGSPSSW